MLRVQIADTPFCSETGGIRGFQSRDPSVNRTAVIRYPDKILKHGVQIMIDYRAVPQPPSLRPEPEYRLDFYEMDRLVGAIMALSSFNPVAFFTLSLKPDVVEMLRRDNPVADQILPPPRG
jgi:hypothetical protein